MFMKLVKDCFRDFTSFGSAYFFILMILVSLILKEIKLFKVLLAGFIVSYLVIIIIRMFYFRRRPDKEKYNSFISRINAASFPSLHAMRVGFLGLVFCLFFSNKYLIALVLVISFLVLYSRIYLKRHYTSDVIVGLILGLILGLVVFLFYFRVIL